MQFCYICEDSFIGESLLTIRGGVSTLIVGRVGVDEWGNAKSTLNGFTHCLARITGNWTSSSLKYIRN